MEFSPVSNNLAYLLWGTYPEGPLSGVALTAVLSISTAISSAILGCVLGICISMSNNAIRWVILVPVAFLRAIPVLMLIFWTYFLLPIAFGVNVPGLLCVTSALTLIGAAYLAHSVRAGIEAIPQGQWHAASSLGLTRWQTLCVIIWPQARRIMAPSFVNQWASLVKDTSLAYVVGVPELSFVAAQVNSRLMIHATEIYLFTAAVYFVLCSGLSVLSGALLNSNGRTAARTMPRRTPEIRSQDSQLAAPPT